ncbi:MAG: type VI secretion system baseplate subunit TssF [Gammaproteobacteria bacterium]
MDARLLSYYNRELRFMREMGAEFAQEFPKIAGRLGLDGFDCSDPYVERLLEGFAFMAARVQLKVDAQFPDFTQHLLEVVYPNYTAPTPAITIAQFLPDPTEGDLSAGYDVKRGSTLKGRLGKEQKTRCEFRTAHDVTLWPIEMTGADYFSSRGAVATLNVPERPDVRAGLRLRMRTLGEVNFSDLPLDTLDVYLRGSEELPGLIYEQLIGNCEGFVVRSASEPDKWHEVRNSDALVQLGFDDDHALLPADAREFDGYRLLNEYFAFPKRFMFVRFQHLLSAMRRCDEQEIEIIVLLNKSADALERVLEPAQFALHCTPAINLFQRRADRIHIDSKRPEYHVVPDRTRPMDYEVYSILDVAGYGKSGEKERDFVPFYSMKDRGYRAQSNAYFSQQRRPRQLSERQKRYSSRTSYLGSEVYLGLVDERDIPYSSSLRQLAVTTLCTNRDLPMLMPIGGSTSDFELQSGAPVSSIKCLETPSRPIAVAIDGSAPWRLISHLSLNYLSLMDSAGVEPGAAMREMLGLYANQADPATRKQIEGLVACAGQPVVRRMPVAGPISFGRGLQIDVTMDESAFEGVGVFLLGAVLERFFGKYTSLNSFTETVIRSSDRGEVHTWPARTGMRNVL